MPKYAENVAVLKIITAHVKTDSISAYTKNKIWITMLCPICNSKNTNQYRSLGIFNLNAVHCNSCGFKEDFQ